MDTITWVNRFEANHSGTGSRLKFYWKINEDFFRQLLNDGKPSMTDHDPDDLGEDLFDCADATAWLARLLTVAGEEPH